MLDNCHQSTPSPKQRERHLPKRIILVRHGESAGNIDGAAYATTPDNRIPLTPQGVEQAERAGAQIYDVVSAGGACSNWKVYFYVSPYARTRSTLRGIGRAFPRSKIIGAREECRIREQDFGNFQVAERMKVIKEIRERFGRFFYRFPEGESAADVFDRVSSFLESLWRDIDMHRLHRDPSEELNLVIISHGLAIRVFLMKWFKWTVEQFEHLNNLGNTEFQVMQLGEGGEYSLAVQHSEEKLQEWGLSPDMIADQRWRAQANKGDWNDSCPWYLDSFFDKFADSNSEDEYGYGGRGGREREICEMLSCLVLVCLPGKGFWKSKVIKFMWEKESIIWEGETNFGKAKKLPNFSNGVDRDLTLHHYKTRDRIKYKYS